MKKSIIYPIIVFSIILLTGCAMFNLPFYGGTSTAIKLSDYCSIAFIDPETNQPFNSPITLPASVVIKYEYTGHYPASSLSLNVVQTANQKKWLGASNLNPKYATVSFIDHTDAGDFMVSSTLTTIDGHSVHASELLHIVDPSPATITDFEFYLTQNATLVPETANNAFLWMKIKDEESILFSKNILASLINRSKLYINGRDMTTSGFPPESAIISDSGKEMICIAILNIQANNAILNTPVIQEGENNMLFVFEGFNVDGSGLIEKRLTLSAAYPDTKAPRVQTEFMSVDPASDPLDFSVTDEFFISLETEDLPEKYGYKPAGLNQLTWTVYGESGVSTSNTIDLSYLDREAEFTDYIPLRMREYGWSSGIYRLRISVEDKNGNVALVGPKTFSYNVTNFKPLDILVEKLSGDMGAIEFYAGESIRFTIDSDETLNDIQWTSYPEIDLVPNDLLKSADYNEASYGSYEVAVQAVKNGIPYVGSAQLTVKATQSYVAGPVITVDESTIDYTNPSKPFVINVTTLEENPLSPDPKDTLKQKRLMYFKGGTLEGAKVEIYPQSYESLYEQSFTCMVLTPSGSPIILGSSDRIDLTLGAEDAAGNEREKTILFSNESSTQ
jgi:hypothetical protein